MTKLQQTPNPLNVRKAVISRDSRGEAAQVSPGTAAVRRASPGGALGGGVAGALAAPLRHTVSVGELDHVEQRERVQEPS